MCLLESGAYQGRGAHFISECGEILLEKITTDTLKEEVGKVCIRANCGPPRRSLSGFCSIKQLRVILLPPGWDANPSEGYPQH